MTIDNKIQENSNDLSEKFKQWFASSKVVDSSGNPLPVYHGTARPDRIGSVFLKNRATAGPMAYFTDDPQIAQSYAQGKEDTSITDEYDDYAKWFMVKMPEFRKPVPLDQAWNLLSYSEKAKIAVLSPRVVYRDDDDQIVLGDSSVDNGVGNYKQSLRQHKGNVFSALLDGWITSGMLHGDEERFISVLKLCGFQYPVLFSHPQQKTPFVYKVYLSIQNPLNTGHIPESVIAALKRAAAKQPYKREEISFSWNKKTFDAREWIRQLTNPDTEQFVWTVIPDWVTRTLKKLGYDGIEDTGGKHGGTPHTVWIPFDPKQIKSVDAKMFDPTKRSIFKEMFKAPSAISADWSKIQKIAPGTTSKMINVYQTEYKIGDRQIEIQMLDDEEAPDRFGLNLSSPGYEVCFFVDNTLYSQKGTSTAATVDIFKSIVSHIAGFIKQHPCHYITFWGRRDQASKIKLYDALVKKLKPQLGAKSAEKFFGRSKIWILYDFESQGITEAGGVGLVVPGVNMPAGMHKDEIRRQAKKFGNKTSATGVPPLARTDGKISEAVNVDNIKGIGAVPLNQEVDYMGVKVMMPPSVFLRLAAHLQTPNTHSVSFIANELSQGKSIASPWLYVQIPESWHNGDLSQPAQVDGHEGRNRMIAVQKIQGDAPIEVHLFFRDGLRNRHITKKWLEQLRAGMYKEHTHELVPGPLWTTPQDITNGQITEMSKKPKPTNPKLWSRAKAWAKRTYDVYPSAYANAGASKWYKQHGGKWRMSEENIALTEADLQCVNITEDVDYCVNCGNLVLPEAYSGGLRKWFKQKWVNIAKKQHGKYAPCGSSGEDRGYAKCVPAKKAHAMSKQEKQRAIRRKRRAQRAAGRPGKASAGSGHKPVWVKTDEAQEPVVKQQYKVVWGPNQREAVDSHLVMATSETDAKKQVRKLLQNTYGDLKFHPELKILFAMLVDKKP